MERRPDVHQFEDNKFYDDEAEKIFKNFEGQSKSKKRKTKKVKSYGYFDVVNPSYE